MRQTLFPYLPLSAILSFPLLAAAAPMTVSAVRETEKIRPSASPPTQSAIVLSCAQNEFCAFQVAVTAPAGASVQVTDISLGDLSGPAGARLSGSAALVYREGWMNVTTPSNGAGATGPWPDPMIPKVDDFYGETRNAFPWSVPAGETQAFWVELHVPNGQAAGPYSGVATVTGGGATLPLSVTIDVRGFALPSTASLRSAYGFDWDGPCIGHFGGYGGPNCDDAQLEALNALYFRDALNHRITISQLVYAPPVQNGQGSFTTFDSLYGPFLNGDALPGSDQLSGAQITSIQYVGDLASASYAAWATHFKAHGWFDKVFDYTCDEPPATCAWSDIPNRASIVHAGDPNFRTLVTTDIASAQQHGVLSAIDIIVPIIDAMFNGGSSTRASYDTFLTEPNKLLWMYQSCEPSSSCTNGDTTDNLLGWPTDFIDEAAIGNRVMPWMDFLYQTTADLYYDTTYAMATQDAWQSQYEFGNNGDGSFFYPGKPAIIGGTHDIPIESFRLKMLREGMQDYEYLHRLDTLGDGAFARTELSRVVTNAGDFTSDPAVLDQARLDMAAEIEKDLGTAPGGGSSSSSGGSGSSSGGSGSGGSATSGGSSGATATSSSGGSAGPDGGEAADAGTMAKDAGSGGVRSDAGSPATGDKTSSPDGGVPSNGGDGGLATAGISKVVHIPAPLPASCGCGNGPGSRSAAVADVMLLALAAITLRRRGKRVPA